MTQENIRQIGKLLLLASVSLSCIAATEAGQQVVKAIGIEIPLTAAPPTQEPSANRAIPDQSAPIAPSAAPLNAEPGRNQARSQPAPKANTANSANSAQRSKLAINTGTREEASQQQVAQISQTQIAANTWQGASFPVEDFQAYTSPFGYRSSPSGGYTQEFHYGLDMAAPEGSYIRTWWNGKVVEVSDDSNCGTSVVVESGPWMHIYCHMQGHVEEEDGKRYLIDRDGGLQIWEDQQIQAGSRLGRVGMTGRTTGPHLHWGLKYDKNWVDPALVLRAMYDNQQQTASVSQERVQ
jgi:murein DD-endopeptidase MepM/ murein hydrolase activator NlpD